MIERTLVLLKPDAVQRALVGEIIHRFERAGLKIVGLKMIWVTEEFARKHYPEDLIPIIGRKTLEDWKELGISAEESPEELGKRAHEDLIRFTTEAPVIAMVLEGVHAVKIVRKMVGHTSPHKAEPGTIRGDYSTISMGYATKRGFGGRNLIHASGTPEEAEHEIELWFSPNEIYDYPTVHEKHVK
ncbi:nucleoside-diphosphate kinase [Candidatus Woesearchaeota archaeon]|nr:nucleoside-diphosphate kinase [Candidatus Woesearchaeota archaeon]RLE43264.1 MAG: nucleoside-diphosphate kinase [Candidatus Woesearchaeota archaeon]